MTAPSDSSKPENPGITRETLQNWRVASLARERDGAEASIATEDQLLESRRLVIADDADVSDFWVFGYGSLIYNPIIDHKQRAIASIYGYHRRFVYGQKLGAGHQTALGWFYRLIVGGLAKVLPFN